eukprot:Selendium_serpulae@DN3199_c0_g2_i2.p1
MRVLRFWMRTILLVGFTTALLLLTTFHHFPDFGTLRGLHGRLKRCDRPAKDIFFDVGANQGDMIFAFYSKRHRSNSVNPLWKFPKGNYDPRKWQVYAFEASPAHYAALHELKESLDAPLLDIEMGAVWNEAGLALDLSVDDSTLGKAHAGWGSSVMMDWKREGGSGTIHNLLTIDFAHFVRETCVEIAWC